MTSFKLLVALALAVYGKTTVKVSSKMTNFSEQKLQIDDQEQFLQKHLMCTPKACAEDTSMCVEKASNLQVEGDFSEKNCECDEDAADDDECQNRMWMHLGATKCSSKMLGKCLNQKTHEIQMVTTEKSCMLRNDAEEETMDNGDNVWRYIPAGLNLGQCKNTLTDEFEDHHTEVSCKDKNDKDAKEKGIDAASVQTWSFSAEYSLHIGCKAIKRHTEGKMFGVRYVEAETCLEHHASKLFASKSSKKVKVQTCSCHLNACSQWWENTLNYASEVDGQTQEIIAPKPEEEVKPEEAAPAEAPVEAQPQADAAPVAEEKPKMI